MESEGKSQLSEFKINDEDLIQRTPEVKERIIKASGYFSDPSDQAITNKFSSQIKELSQIDDLVFECPSSQSDDGPQYDSPALELKIGMIDPDISK